MKLLIKLLTYYFATMSALGGILLIASLRRFNDSSYDLAQNDVVGILVISILVTCASTLALLFIGNDKSELNHHKMVHLDHKKWEDEYKQYIDEEGDIR
tara:strand:- start:1099 stop:1395 length:297 start_codon:yes stop_codon:yes gene_type:complete